MALKTKLSETAYPTADPGQYLTGATWEELDPVLAGRLAYLARDKRVKLKITEGYRSTARQAELYKMYQDYLKTGKGSIKLAAKPGTSWHEYRLAVDTSTQPIRGMNNTQLSRYGLCKPIASEGWHIQPIETSGKSNKAAYAPEEVEDLTRDETLALIKEVLAGADSKPSEWAQAELRDAIRAGITDGNRPGGYATREQVASMILRATKGAK